MLDLILYTSTDHRTFINKQEVGFVEDYTRYGEHTKLNGINYAIIRKLLIILILRITKKIF